MDKTQPDTIEKLNRANALLVTICSGLEAEGIPFPPELLDWWLGYKKELEPRIQLVS